MNYISSQETQNTPSVKMILVLTRCLHR